MIARSVGVGTLLFYNIIYMGLKYALSGRSERLPRMGGLRPLETVINSKNGHWNVGFGLASHPFA